MLSLHATAVALLLSSAIAVCPVWAQDRAKTVHLKPFFDALGATEGCLLDLSVGKPIAAYAKKPGGSVMVVMQPSPGGSCSLGPETYVCTELALSPKAADAMRAVCQPPCRELGGFWYCESWSSLLPLARLVTELFRSESFTGGRLEDDAAIVFGEPDPSSPGQAPAVLMDSSGQKAKLELTTPSIRRRSADDALNQIKAAGVRLSTVRWLGSTAGQPIIDSGGYVYGGGAAPGTRLIDVAALPNRLAAFKAQVEVEDMRLDRKIVFQGLLLLMLDPSHDVTTLKDKGYVFNPKVYLLE